MTSSYGLHAEMSCSYRPVSADEAGPFDVEARWTRSYTSDRSSLMKPDRLTQRQDGPAKIQRQPYLLTALPEAFTWYFDLIKWQHFIIKLK